MFQNKFGYYDLIENFLRYILVKFELSSLRNNEDMGEKLLTGNNMDKTLVFSFS